ncbi:MAG: SPFH domain-containing protein [Deltaproteobacteria bacterium]|nr:SPFH domain-containing protein [Deltaproteobacteria bacterium]
MSSTPPIKLKLPGKRFKALGGVGLGAVAVGVGLVLALGSSVTVTIGPDQFAVRQVFLGPSQGVGDRVFGPGLHLQIPGYERYHKVPRDMQVLELNDSEASHVHKSWEDFKVAPAIRIQTSEGYQVTVDVSVLYRVVDPYTVLTRIPGGLYTEKVVIPEADKILRQTLGELDAEDFYSETRRFEKADMARKQLQAQLEPYGIQCWGVMVRDYTYDARYQQLIEDRKIQDQNVFKNKAEAIAASREAEKNRVLAEGQATIGVEKERGLADIRMIDATADLYYRETVAAGDLMVALAEAEGTRLENRALQQAGASNIVGLEMAEALKGTEIIVVSTTGEGGMNPLNLESMLKGW